MKVHKKIAIVTDSTCDLTEEVLNELNIHFLPLKIIYKDKEYMDRINITPEQVYEAFEKEIPTTSLPGVDEIKKKYLELKEEGYTHIIAIHISGGLSSTVNICKMVSNEIEGIEVEVIDSGMLSMALGRLVLYARNLIDNQKLSFSNIISKIRNKMDEINAYFVVSTLKYLVKGGRIGKVKGTLGELLNIKPIISINKDGEYYTFDKARSRKKSITRLYNIALEKIQKGICYVDVMHADAREEAEKLYNRFKDLKTVKDSFLGEISPAMAVHAGPGLIGICISFV